MKIAMVILAVSALLLLLYALAVRGRKGHAGLAALRGWNYAHRGLHDETQPENSMAAFRAALEKGYGMELDVHLLADGQLAVIHDSTLLRTTGAEGRIEDLTEQQLSDYRLEGTEETIPSFRKLLELVAGKVPLIVELKPVGNNHAQLCRTACDMLDNYPGVYCVESFDPRCIHWLKKNRPQVIRGQLAENFLSVKNHPVPYLLRLVMTIQLPNFLTLPDFVAYKYKDRKNLGNFLARKLWGVQGVSWTLKTPQEHETAVKEGWIPIFEDYTP